MKKYKVLIEESLKMTVEIEAESPQEAKEIAENRWNNSEYILDSDCFCGVKFSLNNERKAPSYER